MNLWKIFIAIIVFYFLALLQTSFFIYFSFFGFIPNLILILVIFLNFLIKEQKYLGIIYAAIAGFFLDIFSERPIGFNIIILGLTALTIIFIIRKYVRIPIIERN